MRKLTTAVKKIANFKESLNFFKQQKMLTLNISAFLLNFFSSLF